MNDLMKTAAMLCDMDGICGYEDDVRYRIRDMVKPYAQEILTDHMGNLLVFVRGGKRRAAPVLLCAHMDEVGAIVFRISGDGLLYIKPVGYMDRRIFLGKRVHIGRNGLVGVIGTKAIQLCTPEEKRYSPDMTQMYVDIGATDREDALCYVQIGDPVTLEGECIEFGDQRFMAKAIDDRLLCAVMIHLLREPLPYDTWFAFSVCEEDGLRGAEAYTDRIRPRYAMALEGTSAADFPSVSPHLSSTRQGRGAVVSLVDRGTFYNEKMLRTMTKAADESGIRWQYRTAINGRTDSGAISICSGGAMTFGVSVPTRYGHSQVSNVYWPDVEQAVRMARLFIERTEDMK